MEIYAKTIKHDQQRYDTCGDYWIFPGLINIRVSDMGNEDYNFLVAVHEIIEAYLTNKRGIREEDITEFDKRFKGDGEPGDAENSPYRLEHQFADMIEKLIADEIGVNWNEYQTAMNVLFEEED